MTSGQKGLGEERRGASLMQRKQEKQCRIKVTEPLTKMPKQRPSLHN